MFADDVEAHESRRHPSGWEPGIAWSGDAGTITTPPMDSEPTGGVWHELVADWGLDPATTEVVPGSIQVRAWDTHDGRRLRYYRAALQAFDAADPETGKKVDASVKGMDRELAGHPARSPFW